MKPQNEEELKRNALEKAKIELHWNHVSVVRQTAETLWKKLCDIGELGLARKLAHRASTHDASKFTGVEFEGLHLKDFKDQRLIDAVNQHRSVNDHHPEFHVDGIKGMSREQIAEMVCDWSARSKERGTGLREWIKEDAVKRFNFTLQSKCYKDIKFFVDLLLDDPFKEIK
tara:strand:+ start:2395 stop:2907 length:513 start_codon:yes stop_codon:yes gene_type:complete